MLDGHGTLICFKRFDIERLHVRKDNDMTKVNITVQNIFASHVVIDHRTAVHVP